VKAKFYASVQAIISVDVNTEVNTATAVSCSHSIQEKNITVLQKNEFILLEIPNLVINCLFVKVKFQVGVIHFNSGKAYCCYVTAPTEFECGVSS
jgi:hypothetical protein